MDVLASTSLQVTNTSSAAGQLDAEPASWAVAEMARDGDMVRITAVNRELVDISNNGVVTKPPGGMPS